ncbi:type 4a pilus biogenesis protein PilO [Marinihelvus fidelis]|uniref:Type 4a pilus biogenesis protein PilO n=1 Tax=Marinihelvus fidelis TaxID=2613842 RepID=A0A5N0T960_9GAMM|nr:type 4a pilus biogenesis protein PilO [Marinihelvus fidelis]KAA9131268.1 type 4a pilus biogenesis protein PilO [Marinihelvus fidelis]
MLEDLRNTDFSDIGSATPAVRAFLLVLILVVLLVAGYFLLVKEKTEVLERVEQQEFALRSDFEEKQRKAANLPDYEQQLEEMQELLETMFRQLPGKTEMDKLLVDISQTALAAGIDVQLFEPLAEVQQDFYAERPISIRMMGNFHEFGEFVSGVAGLPRVVILTMHNVSLRRATGSAAAEGRLILEGQVKTYRYLDENEISQAQAGGAQ